MNSLLIVIAAAAALSAGFEVSFQPGSRDGAGRFMGGTEMRVLAAHGGKLYAGNGYWEDTPGPEGRQGSQILVLDAPDAGWRVDHDFAERLPDGRHRDLAVSALDEARFTTDANGKPLPTPVSLLIAANWDLSGTAQVFSRDDATGGWTASTLAQDRRSPVFCRRFAALVGIATAPPASTWSLLGSTRVACLAAPTIRLSPAASVGA
jgi:hypothetical protein